MEEHISSRKINRKTHGSQANGKQNSARNLEQVKILSIVVIISLFFSSYSLIVVFLSLSSSNINCLVVVFCKVIFAWVDP